MDPLYLVPEFRFGLARSGTLGVAKLESAIDEKDNHGYPAVILCPRVYYHMQNINNYDACIK